MRSVPAFALALSLLALAAPASAYHICNSPPESTHTYGAPGSVAATTAQSGTVGGGTAVVFDAGPNLEDCNHNGIPDEFDGDYETGVGGAYLGIAGNEQVNNDCGLGLHLHAGDTVTVVDVGGPVAFSAGYEGWDPVNEVYCEVDGVIGDDAEDCIESFFGGSAPVDPCAGTDTHAGQNLDAGVWVFVECSATDSPSVSCAISGTVSVP